MKLEELKELNLPHYKRHNPEEIVVGDAVATAMVSSAAHAWVHGYAKKGNSYHFSFQQGISQVEDPQYPGSRDKPKDFLVFVVGLVDDGKVHSLAYATSRNHETKKIHTLRLTNIEQIIQLGDYRLILKNE
jgi:hypothetical protein